MTFRAAVRRLLSVAAIVAMPLATMPLVTAPPAAAAPPATAISGTVESGTGAAGAADSGTADSGTVTPVASISASVTSGTPVTYKAATPDAFDPGLIISDYNFFNADAMTPTQIQEFLEARDCAPRDDSVCLSEYRETTQSQPAQEPGHCTAYPGARAEQASRIIARVSQACGISPRVLLVLLQKEQSLLTRPSASGYLRATGYGCPDTADCNAEYFGFFNQVYHAAWQFRQYTQHPVRKFAVGTTDVALHPDATCGTTDVDIRNQATANLYNYTPYQPNAAALSRVTDSGDACSAYGNLNFWKFYNRWFGPSESVRYPSFLDECLNLVGGQPCRSPDLVPSLNPLAS